MIRDPHDFRSSPCAGSARSLSSPSLPLLVWRQPFPCERVCSQSQATTGGAHACSGVIGVDATFPKPLVAGPAAAWTYPLTAGLLLVGTTGLQ